VRFSPILLALLALAGCNRGIDNKEAVRQGVIDYLSARSNLNIASMDVDVTSVSFRQNEADATVSFSPKGGGAVNQGMTMRYTLEKKGNRWVVKSRADSGQDPHGGAMPEGMPAPGAPPAGGSELPPGHPPVSPEKKK
jgi:hypothetical protein